MKYRKKPVVIEALQYTGSGASADRIRRWANSLPPASPRRTENVVSIQTDPDWNENDDLIVFTLEGPLQAAPGDWVIQGVKGEFYPCKPDIFVETYEPAEQGEVK